VADNIRPVPKQVETHESDRIATPEGDGEFDPSQPLRPLPEGALEDPRGNEPDSYERDHK